VVSGFTFLSTNFTPDRYVYGTTGSTDAFVCVLDPLFTNISESEPRDVRDVLMEKGHLVIYVPTPSYVGFDVYDAAGRLVKRVSAGYLPAGRYRFTVETGKGPYTIKVRTGNRVRILRAIM